MCVCCAHVVNFSNKTYLLLQFSLDHSEISMECSIWSCFYGVCFTAKVAIFVLILRSELVCFSHSALYIWMHVEAQRLSGAMVNASDWRAKGPGFKTRLCHLHHFIVLFLLVKFVQFHKSFVFKYVFTISKLTIDEWMVWAVGVYFLYSSLCIWLYVEE